MKGTHNYTMTTRWTGNTGTGTSAYNAYERNHILQAEGKPEIPGSSDPGFRGDKSRYNPEEMLVGSLSTCHMLWYLHLCATAGVIVVDYVDHATGTMIETADGGGYFSEVTLHPEVTITDPAMIETANSLHEKANKLCFIANSVKFPVHHEAKCRV
ncbi:OsmC family protein [Chitinophaga rhizophila]|uniref:OsmC family protein n=1 Tax=Chitinophaga rhizophila TaxID=2866212 RepID=A0ABS7GJX3_9BACT|nr:OsmC family protein [Chitinophaga rhizophila]MBW8688015.1 OsmC family protein [Chitinophaga rhizophila]